MSQYLGLYQLENLHRAQTKFILVAIADTPGVVPPHDLLKPDLIVEAQEASAKIRSRLAELSFPAWWPVVLISRAGGEEVEVARALEAQGLINVFSYRGGWEALLAGT